PAAGETASAPASAPDVRETGGGLSPAAAEHPATAMAAVPAAETSPVSLDGLSLTGAQVEADLTPHRDADGSLVLEGTISIRLRGPLP
ncbi:MAG: hypothetical protein Q4G67_06850, partial [Actinomycetia bacterium]|nr:hypothetical protein [Actinomycetes bacterium]